MFFEIRKYGSSFSDAKNQVILVEDNWNDHNYITMFSAIYFDKIGKQHKLGYLKIGQEGMFTSVPPKKSDKRWPILEMTFDEIKNDCFSVGQDEGYYKNLIKLGATIRKKILAGLHDIAYSKTWCSVALKENVTDVSLLRDVSIESVHGRLNRLALGTDSVSSYSFSFVIPTNYQEQISNLNFDFEVLRDYLPPTNIHVLIGSNGVGKSHLLYEMHKAINVYGASSKKPHFIFHRNSELKFANVGLVSFSAFDKFEPKERDFGINRHVYSFYIGLKKRINNSELFTLKDPEDISGEFALSIEKCRKGSKREVWLDAVKTLESMDPGFRQAEISQLVQMESPNEVKSLFRELSSGHKIVLLTMSRLVEKVQERTLLLIDEPETHLHPPLLAAFIRALSNLLELKNGVAIVATHSPLVLQQVPRQCVYRLRGKRLASKLKRESFGENLADLTHIIFGLEMENAGFYRVVKDTVSAYIQEKGRPTNERELETFFRAIRKRFNNQLGEDAQLAIRTLLFEAVNLTNGTND